MEVVQVQELILRSIQLPLLLHCGVHTFSKDDPGLAIFSDHVAGIYDMSIELMDQDRHNVAKILGVPYHFCKLPM